MSLDVTLNGRTIDLSKALPLVIRDWTTLEKKYGIAPDTLARFSSIAHVVYYVLRKADDSVTQEEVNDLKIDDPVVIAVLEALKLDGAGGSQGNTDPFSSRS
ncbi:MAG: hypothetical protein ACT4P5_09870 [Armatimonadota bacterium]